MPIDSSALRIGTASLAALVLAGCAHKAYDHSAMHARHHGGMHARHHGAMGANATPTVPVKLSTSTPTLASGYKKVASPEAARLYFVNLRNGMTVTSPVKVIFGLSGMGVAPAGVEKEGTGHHHLLVNVNEVDANAPLPANDQFRHFGAGQTETSVELKPGQHTLQLVLGDQNHIPHHPPVLSDRITITVR
ncbi:DUF4399 domain-containing protein [Hydrogenophaga sp.]|uniref:DUF4399 domain-containing protein n=1 Tax=Hydrogenophaga sp. TaxID=1904254 RepID=UPI00271B3778|nr:DUF4399 domain-containing protein [Hydrogenophaga sp.]MDO8906524.1 DUF4399 domain-containing protein [Hydrogenophaga sp.]